MKKFMKVAKVALAGMLALTMMTGVMGCGKKEGEAGMAFKPTRVGETRVKVEADDGEAIEAVIEITEGAPTLVTTKEANFYLEEKLY